MKNSKFLLAVEVIQSLLDDFNYMCDSREKPSYFTRQRKNKMDFKTTVLFMHNFVKKSLQIELDHFFEQFRKCEPPISKQGFTAARRKIKPEAFKKLDRTLVEWFYNKMIIKRLWDTGNVPLMHRDNLEGDVNFHPIEQALLTAACQNIKKIASHLAKLEKVCCNILG